jgi:RNA-binding protein
MNKKSAAGKRPAHARPPRESAPSARTPKSRRAATSARTSKSHRAAPEASAAEAQAKAAPELSDKQRRHLRGLAHELKPVIRLGGAGLTEAVAKETARALHDHELIKVKAPGGDREARDAVFTELAERTGSALVHRIGNVAVLYRPRPDLPRILIPDA